MLLVASRLAKVFPRIPRSLAPLQTNSTAPDTPANQVNKGGQLLVVHQRSEKLGDMRDSGTRDASTPGGGMRASSRAAAP
jgi:hypothetical protein